MEIVKLKNWRESKLRVTLTWTNGSGENCSLSKWKCSAIPRSSLRCNERYITPLARVNKWGGGKKSILSLVFLTQRRKWDAGIFHDAAPLNRVITRSGALRKGSWLSLKPSRPRFTSLFANHFSTWDSVKFPHFRRWPRRSTFHRRAQGRLYIITRGTSSVMNDVPPSFLKTRRRLVRSRSDRKEKERERERGGRAKYNHEITLWRNTRYKGSIVNNLFSFFLSLSFFFIGKYPARFSCHFREI